MKIKSILVSQPQPADIAKTPYGDMMKKYGVNFTFEKFIKLEDVTASELRQEHVKLPEHTAIILTSRNAVDHFFRVAKEMRYAVPETLKYASMSPEITLCAKGWSSFMSPDTAMSILLAMSASLWPRTETPLWPTPTPSASA